MADSVSQSRALTARQQFWLEHLRACREQGMSLRAYTRTNGLSPSAMYSAKRWCKRRGLWPASNAPVLAPTFVPVQVSRAPAVFRVLLPNGTALEVPEQADVALCRDLLALVSALP